MALCGPGRPVESIDDAKVGVSATPACSVEPGATSQESQQSCHTVLRDLLVATLLTITAVTLWTLGICTLLGAHLQAGACLW